MVSRNVESVDAYIAACPEGARDELRALRALIRAAAPDATESIRHGMPFYDLNVVLCAFAAQARAFSFYLLDQEVFARFAPAFPRSAVGKSCVRFKRLADLPDGFVAEAVRAAVEKNSVAFRNRC